MGDLEPDVDQAETETPLATDTPGENETGTDRRPFEPSEDADPNAHEPHGGGTGQDGGAHGDDDKRRRTGSA